MEGWAPGQSAADVDQLLAGPTGTRLAVGTGVGIDLRVLGQGLIVGEDLIDGAATRGVGVQDLVQKGKEGEFGSVNTLAAIVARGVGLEQQRFNALVAETFQVVERTLAQSPAGFCERGVARGVKLAEKGGGGKHVYLLHY